VDVNYLNRDLTDGHCKERSRLLPPTGNRGIRREKIEKVRKEGERTSSPARAILKIHPFKQDFN
jgi:hypothetical protein